MSRVAGWLRLGLTGRVARFSAAAAVVAAAACAPRAPQVPVVTLPAATPAPPAAGPTAAAPDSARRAAPRSSEGDRRFLVVSADDSTVTLLAPSDRWVRPGMYGIAVDPGRRDVLVARLRVITRVADTAVALVTGQTTRMSTDYVAIFRRPVTPLLRQQSFWGGLVTGLAAGAGAVILLLRGR